MLFQTSRLQVRLLRPTDLSPYQELQCNPNVLRYTGAPANTPEEAEKDLSRLISLYQKPDNTFWIWAIVQKENDTLVGTCAIIIEEEGRSEIGYRFLEKHWGNGYASEIIEPLINHGFSKMNLKTIFATVDVLNVASVKMLEKSQLNFIKQEWNDDYQSTDRFYEKII